MERERIVLFDGVCNLCHHSVDFIIRRDPKGQFHFASLQSSRASALLEEHGVPNDLKTMVLIEDGRYSTKSTAALRIARRLRAPWPLLYAFVVVPPFLRDAVYGVIARYRYRWFGKLNACRLPTPELSDRFIE